MFGAIFTIISVPEDLTDRAVAGYPLVSPTQAATMAAGTLVRVTGTITSTPGGYAVEGIYESCGKSDCWVFSWNNFQISDGTSTLIVDTSHTSSPSVWGLAPYDSDGEQLWVLGDVITVEGSIESPGAPVVLNGNGVGATPSSFWSPIDDYLAEGSVGSLLGIMVALTVYYVLTHRRVLLHREKLATPGAFTAHIDVRPVTYEATPPTDGSPPETSERDA